MTNSWQIVSMVDYIHSEKLNAGGQGRGSVRVCLKLSWTRPLSILIQFEPALSWEGGGSSR